MLIGSHAGLITPPLPTPMGGYGARQGQATGVHDDLYVRSLLFADGDVRFALITCDLLNVDREMTARVRETAAAATGIPPACIMLAPSHTHSGPATRLLTAHPAPAEFRAWLPLAMVSSLKQAASNLQQVQLTAASQGVAGLATNRLDPVLPFDDTLRVLACFAPDGVRAVLLNIACHPTVMGPENLLISADWPGAAVRALRGALGGAPWVGFAQGAAGDVSARFTRREQSFAEVQRLGAIVAGQALTLVARAQPEPVPTGTLAVRSQTIRLEPRQLPSPEEAAARVEQARAWLETAQASHAPHGEVRLAETALQGAQIEQAWLGLRDHLEYDAEVQAVRLGPEVALVGVPGELFSSFAQEVRTRSPFGETLVVAYANGYTGYLPDTAAIEQGGYESSSAWTAPGSGSRLVQTALELLAALKQEGSGS